MQFLTEHCRLLSALFAFIWTAIHIHSWWAAPGPSPTGDVFAVYTRARRPELMDREPTVRVQRPPKG